MSYYIILDIIIYPFIQKINDLDFVRKEDIVGIFTYPENWKITSPNTNGNDNEKFKKIAELLKGFPFNYEQWTAGEEKGEELEESHEITLVYDTTDPVMTVEKLIDTYKGIDWMRLLNGIFRGTNIVIKLHDLVRVPSHQSLLQLSNFISNEPKE